MLPSDSTEYPPLQLDVLWTSFDLHSNPFHLAPNDGCSYCYLLLANFLKTRVEKDVCLTSYLAWLATSRAHIPPLGSPRTWIKASAFSDDYLEGKSSFWIFGAFTWWNCSLHAYHASPWAAQPDPKRAPLLFRTSLHRARDRLHSMHGRDSPRLHVAPSPRSAPVVFLKKLFLSVEFRNEFYPNFSRIARVPTNVMKSRSFSII